MPENSLIVLPDVAVSWTTPTLPTTIWLDPNLNYLRTEDGTIITDENGVPIVP